MANIMSTKTLAKKVVNNEETLILDVRNTDAFDDWKIEGEKVEVMNEPYFNLLEGVGPVAEKLQKNQEIIAVCAKGNASGMGDDMLEEAGSTNAYSLEGGMKGWSEHLEPVEIAELTGGGIIYQCVRLGKGCLTYFIESNGEAAIVDTARMTAVYKKFAEKKGVQIKQLIDTHLHADHISGGRALAEEVGGT